MVKGDFICKTCGGKTLKARQAFTHHKQGHDVWSVNTETGELVHRYGEKAEPIAALTGDKHIKDSIKGFQEDEDDMVFILFRGGKVKDMRLKYPLLFPLFELAKKDLQYGGSFHQFLADSVETMFAAAGYELALAPKSQKEIYDEVARLKEEGQLSLIFGEEGLRLEVNHGDKAERAEVRIGAGGDNGEASGEE